MSERIKSLSEKKIEKSLGIESPKSADDLSDLDEVSSSEIRDDDKAKIDIKNEQAEKIKKEIDELKSLSDKDFAKEMYKKLAIEGFELLKMTKSEMDIDPSPRYVEVMATLSGAVVSALDSHRDIETTDRKLDLEKQKIDMRGKEGPTNVTNIAFSGTLQDALRQLKNANNTIKTIDTTIEKNKSE
jgi:hypothetical protein